MSWTLLALRGLEGSLPKGGPDPALVTAWPPMVNYTDRRIGGQWATETVRLTAFVFRFSLFAPPAGPGCARVPAWAGPRYSSTISRVSCLQIVRILRNFVRSLVISMSCAPHFSSLPSRKSALSERSGDPARSRGERSRMDVFCRSAAQTLSKRSGDPERAQRVEGSAVEGRKKVRTSVISTASTAPKCSTFPLPPPSEISNLKSSIPCAQRVEVEPLCRGPCLP